MLADDLKLSSDEDDKDEVGHLLRLLKEWAEKADIIVSISLALLVLTVSFEHSPAHLFIHHKMHLQTVCCGVCVCIALSLQHYINTNIAILLFGELSEPEYTNTKILFCLS